MITNIHQSLKQENGLTTVFHFLTLGAHLTDYPTPKNLNYWWTFGGILTFCLLTQIITGIVLAMHYVAHADLAFASVEHIMRDVNYGWLIRYIHSNGASMFFLSCLHSYF